MANNPNLALRFDEPDKAALVELSQRLQISQTEVVRVLVRRTLAVLQKYDQVQVSAQPAGKGRGSNVHQ